MGVYTNPFSLTTGMIMGLTMPPVRGGRGRGAGGGEGGGGGLGYLVMMARWGGFMQAPMKSTTFSCRVCR